MRGLIRKVLWSALWTGLLAVHAEASEVRELSLSEAIEAAQRDTKSWAEYDAREAAAKAQVDAVEANWWPKITVDAAVLYWSDVSKIDVVDKEQLTSDLQKALTETSDPATQAMLQAFMPTIQGVGGVLMNALPESIMLKDDLNATFGAQVMMPLTPLFKVYQGTKLAQIGVENVEVERAGKSLEISDEVTEVYLKLVYAQLMQEVAQEAFETLQKHVEMAEKYETVGMISHSDVLSAKVEELKAQQSVVEARNGTRLASMKLAQVLSLGRGVELRASDMPRDTFVVTLDTLESYQDRAVAQRTEFRRLELGRQAAERKKTMAYLDYVPQLFLIGRYQYMYGIDALKPRSQAVVGLGMMWTLFDGLGHRAEARQASAEAQAYSAKAEEARDLIELDVAQKYLALSTAIERVKLTQQALELAEENLRTVTAQFANGEAGNTDVLAAQARHAAARADNVKARIDILSAWAGLKLSMGESPTLERDAFL